MASLEAVSNNQSRPIQQPPLRQLCDNIAFARDYDQPLKRNPPILYRSGAYETPPKWRPLPSRGPKLASGTECLLGYRSIQSTG